MSSLSEVPESRAAVQPDGSGSLGRILEWKYGPVAQRGWAPSLRARFNYTTPDDAYEALVYERVSDTTKWLDVGCGRDIFPSNRHTAMVLSRRCALLVGIDPDDNIHENEFLHRSEKTLIEDFRSDTVFDLITLRMVVEHVADPRRTVGALCRLAASGGIVIVYTVGKWSPVSILARATPTFVHRIAKRALWQTEDRDTFPVHYRMNTHRQLKGLFETAGFVEESFAYLDDCRVFQRWKFLNYLELSARRLLHMMNFKYPESCILAVYRKK